MSFLFVYTGHTDKNNVIYRTEFKLIFICWRLKPVMSIFGGKLAQNVENLVKISGSVEGLDNVLVKVSRSVLLSSQNKNIKLIISLDFIGSRLYLLICLGQNHH